MQNIDVRERINEFVNTLPESLSVMAYGSSIAFQSGYRKDEKKQIDLIVMVKDIKKFYDESLKKNSYMYNLIPKIYFNNASREQLKSGAHICYTSNINYNGDTYKKNINIFYKTISNNSFAFS